MAGINSVPTMNDFSELADVSGEVPDFDQFDPWFDLNAASDGNVPNEVRSEAPIGSDNLLTHPEGLNDQVQQPRSSMSPQVTQHVVQGATIPDPSPAVAPPPGPSPAMAAPPAAEMQQMPVLLNQQVDQGVTFPDPSQAMGPPHVPQMQLELPAPIPANQNWGNGFFSPRQSTTSYQSTSQQGQLQAGPQLNVQHQSSASAHMENFHMTYPRPPHRCMHHTLMYEKFQARC